MRAGRSELGKTQGAYLPRRLRDLMQSLETHLQGYLDGEIPGPRAVKGVQEIKLEIQKAITSDYLRWRKHKLEGDG